jgi:hypothetical protein
MNALSFAIAMTSWCSWGSPIPGTLVVTEKPGIFRSIKGFSINSAKTEWVLGDTTSDVPSLVTIFRSPVLHRGIQPVLTVRVDEINQKMLLKNYVKQWMKDYSLLGFEVLQAKPLKINSFPAYVVDVMEAKGEKRLRQVVFLKDQTAVILTCRDRRETFDKTVKECNEIFKSFEWNSSPALSDRKGV